MNIPRKASCAKTSFNQQSLGKNKFTLRSSPGPSRSPLAGRFAMTWTPSDERSRAGLTARGPRGNRTRAQVGEVDTPREGAELESLGLYPPPLLRSSRLF